MSYEQGIEKATEELDYILDVIASGGVHETKDYAAGLVEAFLSAQPTIQWCELHESVMGTEICQMADLMARRLGRNPFDKITCSAVEVRIVERRHMIKRNRQCGIGWHHECTDPFGAMCECECHPWVLRTKIGEVLADPEVQNVLGAVMGFLDGASTQGNATELQIATDREAGATVVRMAKDVLVIPSHIAEVVDAALAGVVLLQEPEGSQ